MKKISMMIAGLLATSQAQALGLGDARVHSHLGEPLQISVPLLLSVEERLAIDRLQAGIGDRAMFERMALEYREGLQRIQISVEKQGANAWLVLRSPQRFHEPMLQFPLDVRIGNTRLARTINILLDPPGIASSTAESRPSALAPLPVQPAQPATGTRPQPSATPRQPQRSDDLYGPVAVQQTLGEIASELRPQGATLHQTLVALWQANPDAFIGNNMNNLMAGSQLRIPTADQVLTLDPAQARQQVLEQYRQRNSARQIAAARPAEASRATAHVTSGATVALPPAEPEATIRATDDEPRLSLLSPAGLERIPEVFRKEVQLLGSRMHELDEENAFLRDRVGDLERHIGALSQQVLLLAENTATLSTAEAQRLSPLQEPVNIQAIPAPASSDAIPSGPARVTAEYVDAPQHTASSPVTDGRSATLPTELHSLSENPYESGLALRHLVLGGMLLLSVGVGAAWYRRLRQRERYREIMHRF